MDSITSQRRKDVQSRKQVYVRPNLISYGSVTVLTKGGGASPPENTTGNNPVTCSQNSAKSCLPSDIRYKQDIVRMGSHKAGFGIYLYEYRSAFQSHFGYGKFLGVLAQEVIECLPEAVVANDSGFFSVDYGVIGTLTAH